MTCDVNLPSIDSANLDTLGPPELPFYQNRTLSKAQTDTEIAKRIVLM